MTEEQMASLFDNGMLPKSENYYRAKDVEEMNGHFLMFNKMLDTLDKPLTQELIKQFHYELKSGVFEDHANGDYKKRPNIVGIYQTTKPENVEKEMSLLIDWYNKQKVDILALAIFHAKYESIHPFQDRNGRTGRLIFFRECLKKEQIPIIIEDRNRNGYLEALKGYREKQILDKLVLFFKKEQEFYFNQCNYFI